MMSAFTIAHRRSSSCLRLFFILVAFLSLPVNGLGSTDTITWGGDNSRAGYQNNHNMNPSVVGSAQFGQIFKTALPGNFNGAKEQLFSQPLVYTTQNGVQYVFIATTQNNIYKLDAKTGAIVASKNLHVPFLTSDLDGCVDINPLIGITGTGVIDPDTDTWYLDSKTYADQSPTGARGKPNGRHYFHAINVNDFSENAGYPIDIEGMVSRNNPSRSFNGGIHHQRPALLDVGKYVYAAYGSHCVQYNFTGWIVGYEKSTGNIVERFTTQGAGVANTIPGAGVWMSGGGMASDNAGSMFFATGNGFASQLNGIPVSGRNPPTSLEEAAVHMSIAEDGSLKPVDFFMPWEKTQLDGADKDLGTTPLELLPSQFSCGSVKRIGVVTGKSGKTYWLDLDNLGGYQNGPNKLDAVLQVYQNENSVYAGAGVYPLEGGYIYINVIQYPSHVFKFSCNNGVPAFTKVADSPEKNAYVLGVGHGTVTSMNDQAGTGLVWTSDVEGTNLRVYNAVPVNGLLTRINAWNVPGITKFTRPVFGDGRAYIGTTQGFLYGFGSPVNLPLNCSSPYDFGDANLNDATTAKTVTCRANINTQVTDLALNGNPNFKISNVPALPLTVAAGSTFSFQALFQPAQVGPLSSDVSINTTNAIAGYSINTPVTLKGTGQSIAPLLGVAPLVLSFTAVITGQQPGGVNQTALFMNQGNGDLSISDIQYSLVGETGPWITPNATSSGPQAGAFTFIDLPATIAGNSQQAVTVNFNPPASGQYAAYLKINSNGGSKIFDTVGTSGSQPSALLQFQTLDGTGWVDYTENTPFTFGNVTQNTSKYLKMRLTNNGTSDSGRLSVTVSKPPFGVAGIIGANNQVDLAEGTSLAPGEFAGATLYCSVPKSQVNLDSYPGNAHWTLNVGDPNFTKQLIQFVCTAITQQGPPLLTNGSAIMRYVGCFKENNPGRQLTIQLYGSVDNTNEMCVKAAADKGFIFAGTQYNRECWASNTIPREQVPEGNCNYPCSGDINELCGGNGLDESPGSYISLFADRTKFDGVVTAPVGPFVNPGVNGYNSLGCYTEATTGRALSQGKTVATFTVANCIAACTGFIYAGMEYGQECYCGNSLGAGSVSTSASKCSMTCKGNSTEYCGAGQMLNLYMLDGTASVSSSTTSVTSTTMTGTLSSSSSTTASLSASGSSTTTSSSARPTATDPYQRLQIGNYAFMGCFKEASTGRALSNLYTNDPMTLEACAAYAASLNNKYWGVEYGRECWSGSTIMGDAAITVLTECSTLCPGDKTEYCGQGSRLQMYSYLPASSSTTSTSLTATSTTTSVPVSTTIIASTTSPGASSSVLSSTSSSVSVTSQTSSSIDSFTSTAYTAVPTTATPTTPVTSAPTTSTTATPTGPTIVQSVGGFTFLSCYAEPATGRALSTLYGNDTMTLEMCAARCAANKYFGLEYARECWCGDSIAVAATPASTGCSMTCKGNSLQYCGGSLRLQMYQKGDAVSATVTLSTSLAASTTSSSGIATISSSVVTTTTTAFTTTTTSSTSTTTQTLTTSSTTSSTAAIYTGPPIVNPGNANFSYAGCIAEPQQGRALPVLVLQSDTAMTVSKCLEAAYKYAYAGLEYGKECWASSSLTSGYQNLTSGVPGTTSAGDCAYPCGGNSTEFCGGYGSARLTLYAFNATKSALNGY